MMDFGKQVTEVWHTGVLGVSLGAVVTAILVVLAFLGLRRVFFRFVVSSLRTMTRKTKLELDDMVLHAVGKPLEFGFVVVGFSTDSNMRSTPHLSKSFINYLK